MTMTHKCRREDDHSSSNSSPHFFKIILSHHSQHGKLGIPRKFMTQHGKDLSEQVVLKVPSGEVWEVKMTRCGDDGSKVWLGNGWQEFAAHFSLDHGHLLFFRYEEGKSYFHVLNFDKSASEIEYPVPKMELETEGLDNTVEILEEEDGGNLKSEIPRQMRKLGGKKEARALEMATSVFKSSKNPCFFGSHASDSHCFRESNAKKKARFRGGGWRAFVLENHLQVGDVCIFALIKFKGVQVSLQVAIFRVSEASNCCKPSKTETGMYL